MAEREPACSVNRTGCTNKVKYACHHCGRLLCDGPNCCKWGWDVAFVGFPIAYHCPECDHIGGLGLLARELIDRSNQFFAYLSHIIKSFKERLKRKDKKEKSSDATDSLSGS